MLTLLEHFPDDLFGISASELHRVLNGPTLIQIPGRLSKPLFVSILLHGNEDIGLHAIQNLLREYRSSALPRALTVFVGNVAAAQHKVRHLPGQPDYNRIWPGGEHDPTLLEARMLEAVLNQLRANPPFASVDLHNNTGLNPHYACLTTLNTSSLQLATLFSRTVVYFTRPRGVQAMALSTLCPAVTLECGRVGDKQGISHAAEFLQSCLHLQQIPSHPVARHDIDLFHTVATLRVPKRIDFGFGECGKPLCLTDDLERLNFSELLPGYVFGHCQQPIHEVIEVINEQGQSVVEDYFAKHSSELVLKRPVMPSMLTKDIDIVQQDCLGYFMERYPLDNTLVH